MKKIIRLLLLSITTVFFSCKMEKQTIVYIKNDNAFPIEVKLTTKNISKTFPKLDAKKEIEEEYIWTGLEKQEGSYFIEVKNLYTNKIDTFVHGYFEGELSNNIDLFAEGNQLKVQILD
ncbi:MAG: hypothetical protein KA275_07585 [Chitinophagaceae bacterium]|nr:hypothetical protein [Chitinophagaceae bacterium]